MNALNRLILVASLAVRDWLLPLAYLAVIAGALWCCSGCDSPRRAATSVPPTPVRPATRTPCASCMLGAFRHLESSGNYAAIGDGGRAWGAYQFHRARWSECGGRAYEWGRADRAVQDRVMMRALQKYMRAGQRRGLCGDELLWWTANYHNVGHGLVRPRRYATRFAELAQECCHGGRRVDRYADVDDEYEYEDFDKF